MNEPKFISQAIESYALAIVFIPAAVLITSLPVVFEAIQHLIEFRFGMFDSADGIPSGKGGNARLAVGAVKLVSIMFICVVVTRYFFHDRDLPVALGFKAPAIRAAFLCLALIAALFGLIFYGAPALAIWIDSQSLGVPDEVLGYLPLIMLIAVFWPLQRHALRLFAATFDDTDVNLDSDELVKHWARQSTLVLLLAIGPAMVLHYCLNLGAIDKPLAVQIAMLTADSFLAGAVNDAG